MPRALVAAPRVRARVHERVDLAKLRAERLVGRAAVPARPRRLRFELGLRQRATLGFQDAAGDVAPLAVGVFDEGHLVGRVRVGLDKGELPVLHFATIARAAPRTCPG
eukprot:COSAG01_NODE_7167_length_3322_cov_2.671114_3_plen_108_part_00